jgi:hypothetical protein
VDKLLHFALAFVLTTSLNACIPKKDADVLTLGACIGKEVCDSQSPANYFDWLDLASGAGGILAADYVLSVISELPRGTQTAD